MNNLYIGGMSISALRAADIMRVLHLLNSEDRNLLLDIGQTGQLRAMYNNYVAETQINKYGKYNYHPFIAALTFAGGGDDRIANEHANALSSMLVPLLVHGLRNLITETQWLDFVTIITGSRETAANVISQTGVSEELTMKMSTAYIEQLKQVFLASTEGIFDPSLISDTIWKLTKLALTLPEFGLLYSSQLALATSSPFSGDVANKYDPHSMINAVECMHYGDFLTELKDLAYHGDKKSKEEKKAKKEKRREKAKEIVNKLEAGVSKVDDFFDAHPALKGVIKNLPFGTTVLASTNALANIKELVQSIQDRKFGRLALIILDLITELPGLSRGKGFTEMTAKLMEKLKLKKGDDSKLVNLFSKIQELLTKMEGKVTKDDLQLVVDSFEHETGYSNPTDNKDKGTGLLNEPDTTHGTGLLDRPITDAIRTKLNNWWQKKGFDPDRLVKLWNGGTKGYKMLEDAGLIEKINSAIKGKPMTGYVLEGNSIFKNKFPKQTVNTITRNVINSLKNNNIAGDVLAGDSDDDFYGDSISYD